MAFAGFSPGEAEGLRRAMSRKRSAAAIEAYHQRFVEGAAAHPRRRRGDRRARLRDDRRLLGLRLPEGPRRRLRPARLPVDLAARALRPGVPVRAAQRAADGLLRVGHARPRGPAPRDRAARRPTSTPARSTVHDRAAERALRCGSGSATSSACARDEVARARRRARGGRAVPLAGRSRLARRRRAAVAGPARVGGRVRLAGRRAATGVTRAGAALWQLGVAAPGEQRAGRARSSRCRSRCPAAPALRALEPWESMIADYATTGLTLGRAPDGAAARARCRPGRSSCRDLERLRARGARCGSAGSSSRASARARPRGSCSSCSRTSSARST